MSRAYWIVLLALIVGCKHAPSKGDVSVHTDGKWNLWDGSKWVPETSISEANQDVWYLAGDSSFLPSMGTYYTGGQPPKLTEDYAEPGIYYHRIYPYTTALDCPRGYKISSSVTTYTDSTQLLVWCVSNPDPPKDLP